MNVLCSATACPVLLSTTCIFYEGENLIYTGINTNDSVQEALQKIDEAFSNNILSINAILPISITSGPNPTISISQASATSNGYISSVDWNIFNNKVPSTRTLTINGTTYDLSANRSWTIPSDNIYNIDGTLTGNRTVSSGGFSLTLNPNTNLAGNLFGNTLRTRNSFSGSYTQNGTVFADSNYIFDGLTFTGNTLYMGQSNIEVTGGSTTVQTQGIDIEQHIKLSGGTSRISASNYILQYRGYSGDISTNSGSVMLGLSISTGHNKSDTTTSIVTGGVTGNAANIFNYVGTINNAYGYSSTLNATTSASHKSSTITNYISFRSTGIVGATSGTSTATITNYYGIYLDTPAVRLTGTITNRWGVYAPDVAMNHYINGTFLIGTTTPSTFKLDVNGTARVSGNLRINSGSNLFWDNVLTAQNRVLFYDDGNSAARTGIGQNAAADLVNFCYNGKSIFFAMGNDATNVTTSNASAYFDASRRLNLNYNLLIPTGTKILMNAGAYGAIYSAANIGMVIEPFDVAAVRPFIVYQNTGGSVGIGDNSVGAINSAQLFLNSTTKGFLPPRMTTVQRDAIASPATGLQVYNSTTNTNDFYNGTSWLSEGNVSGSGVAGQVAYWNGTSSQTGSNNLFWDAANARLGIGTNSPSTTLTVAGGITLSSGSLSLPVAIHSVFGGAYRFWNRGSSRWTFEANNANIGFEFKHIMTSGNAFHIVNTSDTSQFLVSGAGNTILGTTTDGGQRLQVQGDAFIKGSGATSATSALLIQNSGGTQLMRLYNVYQSGAYIGAEFGDGTFAGTTYLNVLNGASSIQTRFIDVNASDAMLSLNGGSGVGNTSLTQTRGSVLLGNQNYALTGSTQNNVVVCVTGSFIPTSGSAGFVDLFVRPTINQTGGANGITRGLYVNPTLTSAADWRSIETSTGKVIFNKDNGPATQADYTLMLKGNNPRLRIEAGTAGSTNADANIQFADSNGDNWIIKRDNANLGLIFGYGWNNSLQQILTLGIRSSDPTITARGAASSTTEVFLAKSFAGSDLFSVRNNGNILVNTGTDAGFKLDVNGTTRLRATGNGGNDGLVVISQNSTAFVNIGYNTLETNQASFTAQRTSGTFSFIVRGLANVIATTSDAFDGMNIQPNNVSQSFKIGYQGIQSTYQDIFLTRNTGEISVGINSTTTFASAVLHASSTTKGFLPPRMTTTQKNAISSPAAGLQVYDSTTSAPNYYNGTAWVALGGGGASIYTADGTLTSNRTVSSGGYSLIFNPQTTYITTLTASTGGSSYSVLGSNTLSFASGFSSSNIGNVYSANGAINLQTFAGSADFAQANLASAMISVNSIDFSAAGATITMTQASGIRAMTGHQSQIQYQGTNSGTITHAAISQNLGFYRPSAATGTLTITNAYSLLINDLNDYTTGFTFTNRWAIYQDGASDNNYFKGKVIIGSTNTVGVSRLNVKDLPTSATGLATGDVWNNGGVLNIV